MPDMTDTAWPFLNFNGRQYPLQTLIGEPQTMGHGFPGYVQGMFQANPAVFACEMARVNLFSEARFQWRRMNSGRPGDLFGTTALASLEKPWPKAVTSDLLTMMLLYADFGGDCFVLRRPDGTLRPLRPDWVGVVFGSLADAKVAAWDVDAVMVAIVYQPGGPGLGRDLQLFPAAEFAHFVSTQDPMRPNGMGMPWVWPIIREVMSDKAATEHKLKFFELGATPNMIVTVDKAYTDDQIGKLRAAISERHTGVLNAYKTLVLRGGETATVVGKDLQQLDFKAVQGASETRISEAAGVPPVVAGLSEGLQGSSLNAGNFQASMRRFADITVRPLWRNAAGSLEAIVPPPDRATLWYDDRDIPALKDDVRDAAEVQGLNATAIRTLVDGGFEPDDVVMAVTSGDLRVLKGKHTGLLPVQLQKPGAKPPEPTIPPDMQPDMEPDAKPTPPTGGAT
jgi:hypothetical protein